MKKSVKIAIGVAAAAVVAAMVLPRYLMKEEVMPTVTPVVEVEQPQTGTIQLFRGLNGSVEPADMVYLTPKLAGEVSMVYVQTGDTVTEGQVLCQLDNKQVESAKISMDMRHCLGGCQDESDQDGSIVSERGYFRPKL
ncbi:MAG: biotin/lipoyl-binding protein [Lachnospiraceae bacterium]